MSRLYKQELLWELQGVTIGLKQAFSPPLNLLNTNFSAHLTRKRLSIFQLCQFFSKNHQAY